MKILGIESSSLVASVAVLKDDSISAEYTLNFKKTHSQTLLPMIDEVITMLDERLETFDAIAVSAGPGSFTGLRIGVATAKGLGLALDKPLINISSLDAMAYNIYGSKALIVPIMDARRNQVYTGSYRNDKEFEIVTRSRAVSIEELVKELNKLGEEVIFLGDGVPVYKEYIKENLKTEFSFAPPSLDRQRASSLAVLASDMLKNGKSPKDFSIDYLRKSQAEREKEEKGEADTKSIQTRELESADISDIENIEKLSFDTPWTTNMLLDMCNNKLDKVLVILKNNKIIGYINWRIIADEAELLRIAILNEFRNEGFGELLIKEMFKALKEANVYECFLEVELTNNPAIKLYEKYGFVESLIRKDYYGKGKSALVMKNILER